MKQFLKDPDAILDYKMDWASWLQEDEAIVASTWDVPEDITKDSDDDTNTAATIWLSGGTEGDEYVLTNRIDTNQGRTDDRSIAIVVRER